MNTTSPWRIERLTPGLRDAYLAFLDDDLTVVRKSLR